MYQALTERCVYVSPLLAHPQSPSSRLEMAQECAEGRFQPPPLLPLHRTFPTPTTPQSTPATSFKEVSPKEKQSPWAAAGSNSSPTVPVMRILLQRELDKGKGVGVMTTERQSKPFQVLTQANWF